MPVKINGATSGSVTLAAPASGSDVNLTLPVQGFGKVLQVVMGSTTTSTASTSTTLADTALSATITPTSATSKVLVLVSQNGIRKDPGHVDNGVYVVLARGTTTIAQLSSLAGWNYSSSYNHVGGVSGAYLDTPATTSAITYRTRMCAGRAGANAVVNEGGEMSMIVLMEVAA